MNEDEFFAGWRNALATEEEIDELFYLLVLRKPHLLGDVVDSGEPAANEPAPR